MNTDEAKQILAHKLAEYRTLTYKQLAEKVDQRSDRYSVTAPSGVLYQVVIHMFWDDKPNEVVRVNGSIDDSGWRAYLPLTDSFLAAPDGSFVGE